MEGRGRSGPAPLAKDKQEQLDDSLEAVEWSQQQLGPRKLVRGKWRLKGSAQALLPPWTFLTQTEGWAFCWKSREPGADLWLGWDILLLLSATEMASLQEGVHDHFIFGGQPFFAEQPSELWGEMSSSQWLLPGVLLRLGADGCDLYLCSDLDKQVELQEKAEELIKALLALNPRSASRSLALPAYERRIDIPEQAEWIESIEQAIECMRNEKLDKVVMSRSVKLEFAHNYSWTQWLEHLLDTREEAFVFGLRSPSGRVFMGRSPERLLAWNSRGFELDAIAGTRSRVGTLQQDRAAARELQDSPKEKREHRLVSEAIAEVLSGEGLTFTAGEEEKLLQLEHVQHMRSRFSGQWASLDEARGFRLLQRLHPTPAVGGVPRPTALDFLRRHEAFERGWFAGYIGFIAGAAGEFAIGIRSALCFQKQLHVFAGAGIVEASEPLAEWRETEQKMQNFLGLLPARSRPKVCDAAAESF